MSEPRIQDERDLELKRQQDVIKRYREAARNLRSAWADYADEYMAIEDVEYFMDNLFELAGLEE